MAACAILEYTDLHGRLAWKRLPVLLHSQSNISMIPFQPQWSQVTSPCQQHQWSQWLTSKVC